eukprot:scaffold199206_cov36-Prasinocladus_malaysianus.AAC.1
MEFPASHDRRHAHCHQRFPRGGDVRVLVCLRLKGDEPLEVAVGILAVVRVQYVLQQQRGVHRHVPNENVALRERLGVWQPWRARLGAPLADGVEVNPQEAGRDCSRKRRSTGLRIFAGQFRRTMSDSEPSNRLEVQRFEQTWFEEIHQGCYPITKKPDSYMTTIQLCFQQGRPTRLIFLKTQQFVMRLNNTQAGI